MSIMMHLGTSPFVSSYASFTPCNKYEEERNSQSKYMSSIYEYARNHHLRILDNPYNYHGVVYYFYYDDKNKQMYKVGVWKSDNTEPEFIPINDKIIKEYNQLS